MVQDIIDGKYKMTSKFSDDKSDISLAEQFNDYYITIGKTALDRFVQVPLKESTSIVPGDTLSAFAQISYKDMGTIRKELKNTAAGPDGISSVVLKMIFRKKGAILERLIIISLNTGVFPKSLKLAQIVPIYKKGA